MLTDRIGKVDFNDYHYGHKLEDFRIPAIPFKGRFAKKNT